MATIQKRERKNGPVYKVVIRIQGYPTQSQSFRRLTDAKAWAQKTETAIREGRFQSLGAEAKKRTLQNVIDRYRTDVLPSKAASTQRAEKTYIAYWEKELGTYALSFIKAESISGLLRELAECGDSRMQNNGDKPIKPKSRKTLKHYRDTLDLLFKYAKQWGWVGTNPVDGVNRITNIRNERVRYLKDDERVRLMDACKASPNKLLYPVVVFALSTGARKGEILKLTIDDIDLGRGVAILRDTKNKDTRAVPVVLHLRELLEDQIKQAEAFYDNMGTAPAKRWLFPRRDGLAPMDIRTAWENARDAAKLVDFRFHDLRHSTASYLAMNGASQIEIAEILGHRTLQMVRRYSHLSEDHTKGVLERMNQSIF